MRFAVRDVADRVAQREAQANRDEVQRGLIAALPVPVTVTTRLSSRILYINQSAIDLFGLAPQQAVGADIRDIYVDPWDRDRLLTMLAQDRAVTDFEVRLRRPDSSLFWALISSSRLMYLGEDAVLTVITVIDRRKQLEEQLQATERDFRGIFENAVEGIFQSSPDGRYLRANPALARIYGYETPDQLMAELSDIGNMLYVDPRRREAFVAHMVEHGVVRGFESEIRRRDGSLIWISESARAIRDGLGGIAHYEGSVEDVTVRRRAEQVLREILEASPIGVLIAGRGGRHLFSNARWRQLGRVPDDRIKDLDVRMFFRSEADRRRIAEALEAQGRVRDLEIEVTALDGTPLWLLVTMERITFEGEPATLAWYYDYSERRRVAEELRLAKENAEAATQAKSTFLATMSHEIRTPMNGVLGLLELLQQTELNPEQRELTSVVRDSASSLLTIIDEILDFSKIEAGKLEIERVAMSPLSLVEGVADTLAPNAHKKKLSLTTFVDASVPPMVEGDPVRLRQILFNLVGNAIKFTERGEIVVRVSVDSAAPGGMMLRAMVRDTGIGLTAEARERLFQPFMQADGTTTRRFGGTGLGLSISKLLVERMGGEIGVDTAPDAGSVFWFTLSVAPSAAPVADEPDLAGLTVLIIEDNPTVQDVLSTYLGMKAVQVEVVDTAEKGLDLLRRYAAASLPVDAIIVDLKLPGMDGLAFRGALSTEPALNAKPCILLTAYDDPGQRGAALAAGFSAYMTKPMRRSTILRALAEACGRSDDLTAPLAAADGTAEAAPDRETALAEGRLILVAEDNPTNQMVIQRQLARLGYAADLVEDGRLGLELFGVSRYGLVITDVHMPKMDGLELTAAIRDFERSEGRDRTPIIALTANVLSGEAERCLAAGMDDHLGKPTSLAQLNEALGRWLPRKTVAAPPTSAAKPVKNAAPAGEAKVLDLERMREIFGTIDGGAVTLLRRYLDSTEPLLAKIGAAVADRRADEARRAVHSAKGASRSAGADELAALCTELEAAIKAEAWSEAASLDARLDLAFARVRETVLRLGVQGS
ncbi:MAG TPA: response regulator [Alphaproteobacteria bacterium]